MHYLPLFFLTDNKLYSTPTRITIHSNIDSNWASVVARKHLQISLIHRNISTISTPLHLYSHESSHISSLYTFFSLSLSSSSFPSLFGQSISRNTLVIYLGRPLNKLIPSRCDLKVGKDNDDDARQPSRAIIISCVGHPTHHQPPMYLPVHYTPVKQLITIESTHNASVHSAVSSRERANEWVLYPIDGVMTIHNIIQRFTCCSSIGRIIIPLSPIVHRPSRCCVWMGGRW